MSEVSQVEYRLVMRGNGDLELLQQCPSGFVPIANRQANLTKLEVFGAFRWTPDAEVVRFVNHLLAYGMVAAPARFTMTVEREADFD